MNQFDTSRLVQGAGDLWHGAINTAFLDSVADGTLPRDAFDRWLVQDYLFVRQLTNFAALSTSKASRDAQRVLITGRYDGGPDAPAGVACPCASSAGFTSPH